MNNIFLVFGYGVPKGILKDENYNFYLKMVLNKIYDISVKNKIKKPLIIFCGGKTDCFKPYGRNEAGEMAKLFAKLIRQKPFLKPITKDWLFISEKESLSTLESLINSRKIILGRTIKRANLFILCEQTRGQRIKILAKKIFNKNYNFQILPIDFDVSANRYLPLDYLAKREKMELKHALGALSNPENLQKHHEASEEKLKYFRKIKNKKHADTVKIWWDKKIKEGKIQAA